MPKEFQDLPHAEHTACLADSQHLIGPLLEAARPRDRDALKLFLFTPNAPIPMCVTWFIYGFHHQARPQSFDNNGGIAIGLVAPFLSAGIFARHEHGVTDAYKRLEILFTTFYDMQRLQGRV